MRRRSAYDLRLSCITTKAMLRVREGWESPRSRPVAQSFFLRVGNKKLTASDGKGRRAVMRRLSAYGLRLSCINAKTILKVREE